MAVLWIVVADGAQARVLATAGPLEGAKQVQIFHNASARMKDSDLVSDAPGRRYDAGSPNKSHQGNFQSAKEYSKVTFARKIAEFLDNSRNDGRFSRLELVAAPEFLGLLRKELSQQTLKLVETEIDKDLVNEDINELREHLIDLHSQ